MAKITIAGDAVVVTSSMKLEDLKTIEKYRPEALILKGGEDGKEPIFAVTTKSVSDGSINVNGATFTKETRDGEKLATVTMVLTGADASGDVKETVADLLGAAIINLSKLEETLPEVLTGIADEKAAVMGAITIA